MVEQCEVLTFWNVGHSPGTAELISRIIYFFFHDGTEGGVGRTTGKQKGKSGTYAMKCVAADDNLPTPCHLSLRNVKSATTRNHSYTMCERACVCVCVCSIGSLDETERALAFGFVAMQESAFSMRLKLLHYWLACRSRH